MARKLILLLILINISFAWKIEGQVSPHSGTRSTLITINYELNISGQGRVKVYLNRYDQSCNCFDYTIDKTLIDYFEANPSNISPIKLTLKNEPSWFYRICLKLSYNGKYYKDCDSQNQFLLVDDTPIIQQVIDNSPKVKMSASIPEIIYVNETFPINITIWNDGDGKNISIYSYAYGKTKASKGSWASNAKQVFLSKGGSTNLTLFNEIFLLGNLTLKVRANYGKKLDLIFHINVIQRPKEKILLDEKIVNNLTRITLTNLGNAEKNVSLVIFSDNSTNIKNLIAKPKKSYEYFINSSKFAGAVASEKLFDAGLIYFNSSPKIIIKKIEKLKIIKQDYQKEMLLYATIVSFSLAGLWLMLR